MNRLVIVNQAEELADLPDGEVECLGYETFQRAAVQCHLALIDKQDRLVARCSLWRARNAQDEATTDGLIGHYAAVDADAGVELLHHAVRQHERKECDRVIGPMDGSTWHRYRLVTDRGTEPTFFLEPDNPSDWPMHFTNAGFSPVASYLSALNPDISRVDPRSDLRRAELARNGIHIRHVNVENFNEELSAIHKLSLSAFANNRFYSPIEFENFKASYEPLRTFVRPELVLLAEQDDRLIGFIFAIPNFSEADRGEPLRTTIHKTLAVHPDYVDSGLGTVLSDDCQRAARQLGFDRAIYALMEETNVSWLMSIPYAKIIRRYTLYGKQLGQVEH